MAEASRALNVEPQQVVLGEAESTAGTKRAAFNVAELAGHEQRVIAPAAEVAVVRRPLPVAVGRALGRIHVEDDQLPLPALVNPINSGPGQITRGIPLDSEGSTTPASSVGTGWTTS